MNSSSKATKKYEYLYRVGNCAVIEVRNGFAVVFISYHGSIYKIYKRKGNAMNCVDKLAKESCQHWDIKE